VDIFDAGPCVCCERDEIRTVKESRVGAVREVTDQQIAGPTFIVGTRGGEFRAGAGPIDAADGGVRIGSDLARALRVDVGSDVRFAPLRPLATSTGAASLELAARDREGSD
jgi:arginine N-succinyltransferase